MSDTIKSLATLLSAVRGLNEDKKAMEQYAAKKLIDMKLEEQLYEKKLADKRIENTVNSFTDAEAAVLTGQSTGTLDSVGDVQRTIKKKQVGAGAFASIFGMLGMQAPLYQRRFGKKQVDAIREGLGGYSDVITEVKAAKRLGVDIEKDPEIVRQMRVYREMLNEINVDRLPNAYKDTFIAQNSLIDTYLGD